MLFLFSKLLWRSCLFGTEILAFLALVLLLGSMARGSFNDDLPPKRLEPFLSEACDLIHSQRAIGKHRWADGR